MKVFYDGVIFTRQLTGGVNRIYDHLEIELSEVAPSTNVRYFRFPSDLDAHRVLRQSHYRIPKIGGLLRRLDRYVFLPRAVRSFEPDVFHTSYFRVPNHIESATVVTVYDMIHERFPELFDDAEWTTSMKRDSVERADHIIAISECTKRDLIEYFDVTPEKVTVTPLAASPFFRPVDDDAVASMRERYDIDGQFLLYVGRRARYKNFITLLRAYADWRYCGEVPLLCVGGDSEWNEKESALISDEGISDSVRLLDGVGDQQLRTFYTAATAFVYPSKYEGFGIPPLEAMQCGTPVIVSNVSSIPEVVGDAGLYIDPDDTSDITTALTTIVTDHNRRRSLVESGFERAEKFTWKSTAQQTYDIYEQII